jgi:hypothetical protein
MCSTAGVADTEGHHRALVAKEGYSVSQFLASPAGEKLAVVLTMDNIRRDDFENYLASVPDVPPMPDEEL